MPNHISSCNCDSSRNEPLGVLGGAPVSPRLRSEGEGGEGDGGSSSNHNEGNCSSNRSSNSNSSYRRGNSSGDP